MSEVEFGDIHFDPIRSIVNSLPMSEKRLAITAENPLLSFVKPSNPNEIKKRPTKWGEEWEKIFSPPSVPGISRSLPLEDTEYLLRLYRLDELIKKKNLGQIELLDSDIRYKKFNQIAEP